MDKYVFYRASEEVPHLQEIDKEPQIAIPLEDKDFMIMTFLRTIIKRLEALRET